MKFKFPGIHNSQPIEMESVFEEDTTLMGINGKAYYCLSSDDSDIFDVLSSKILDPKSPLDRLKYSEGGSNRA